MKSKDFFSELALRVDLKPGTCRAYLNIAGFRPAAKVQRPKYVECLWEPQQLDQAVQAIKRFMSRHTEVK